MKLQTFTRVFATLLVALSGASFSLAQGEHRISQPYTYKNLSIFLIHGKDQNSKGNILTLQEALSRGIFRVYETGEVNELEVENLSKQFEVFIQAGDIVKGGKQDRVLAVSIIIPSASGRVSIESFCVESGRWTKRGNEDASKFDSSNDRVVTKELKIAAGAARNQQEVWNQVSQAQERLAKNVGGSIADGTSASSLQLSLENRRVAANVDDYIKALDQIIAGKSDVIGYAFAINGKINSADIYASNALFKKVWAKNLKATATEAVAELRGVRLAEPVKAEAVKTFMDDSDKAKARDRAIGAGTRMVTREDKDNVVLEAVDEKTRVVVHKNYVKKH